MTEVEYIKLILLGKTCRNCFHLDDRFRYLENHERVYYCLLLKKEVDKNDPICSEFERPLGIYD
jgi:hypothetical protein